MTWIPWVGNNHREVTVTVTPSIHGHEPGFFFHGGNPPHVFGIFTPKIGEDEPILTI